MECPNCGNELEEGVKSCDECGQILRAEKKPILSDDEIASIEASSQTDEYSTKLRRIIEEGLAIERRDVAVLCVDVSDFLSILSSVRQEDVREVVRDVYSVMSGAITRCGGYVDGFIADEVMAIFGAPIVLERACERVITAVDEIEIGLAAVNFRFKDLLPTLLTVHSGIAFGQVEAGRFGHNQRLEYTILDETVDLAKRLTESAPSGTTFVSPRVKRLAEGAFEFQSAGIQQLPGISKPLEAFRLVGPKTFAGERIRLSELGASMFGREKELGRLQAASAKLEGCYPDPKPCEVGEGEYRAVSRIFAITGDAGIGKSRLKRELRHYIHERWGPNAVSYTHLTLPTN